MRPRTGSLRWPTHGTGWLWGVEVLAAMRHCTIDVKDVWTYRTPCHHRPFDYLNTLYRERRQRKDAGDPTEFVLKLALNATYGALAEHPVRQQKEPPKFRCLPWAGWITAATRAKLLDALCDDVVMMATDCLVSRVPLDVTLGDGLGEWELTTYDRLWVAGTGIYFGQRDGEWTTTKTRGFESGQLSREVFDALWREHGRLGHVRFTRHRFIGMGTAMHRVRGFYPPWDRLWRQFIDEPCDKTLDMTPRRRWLTDDVHDGRSVAPALHEHRKLEREDIERLRALRERYDTLAVRVEQLEATVASPRTRSGRKALSSAVIERTLREMLIVHQAIKSAERGGSSVFDWADDPQTHG